LTIKNEYTVIQAGKAHVFNISDTEIQIDEVRTNSFLQALNMYDEYYQPEPVRDFIVRLKQMESVGLNSRPSGLELTIGKSEPVHLLEKKL
jgi:hypothetical protein